MTAAETPWQRCAPCQESSRELWPEGSTSSRWTKYQRFHGLSSTSFALVWDLSTLPCGDLSILGQTRRIEDFDHSGNLRSVTIHFLMGLSLSDAIGQAAVAQCLKFISEEPIFEE